MKILLIDNTFDPPHGSPEIRQHLEESATALGASVEVHAVRAPECKIPTDLRGYAGAVLSGSKTRIDENAPWIELEMAAIRELHQRRIPTLGICYGEQLIAKTLGGQTHTGVAANSEHGWVELELLSESPILKGLPSRFYTFEYHSDEVRTLPANFRLTARSALCPVQAYDVLDAPMWGLQFHPERGLEEGNRGLDRRAKANPDFRPINRDLGEKVYDASVARTIFQNFLRLVSVGRGMER